MFKMDDKLYCVAVHAGAGAHHLSKDSEVRQVMWRACKQSLEILMNGTSALIAVNRAIMVLEDETCLNAGNGSNLTIEGTVECDAAIMDGRTGDFGAVGAVSGVKNPISLATAVLDNSRILDTIGRIPPIMLVADGAESFAAAKDLDMVSPGSLVSPTARAEWKKWKARLESSNQFSAQSELADFQDTVGAVTLSMDGDLAAGVSSGGLLLKPAGRIGEAAIFGAGCWAEQSLKDGMACSVSGAGEHIVRCSLAKSVGAALKSSNTEVVDTHAVLLDTLIDGFWKPCRERRVSNPDAGILLLTKEADEDGKTVPRLLCAFTTDSMAVGYASSKDPKPKVKILRRPEQVGMDETPRIYITSLPL